MPKIFSGISRIALKEQDRWVLWVPVLFGLGIAAYFSLPTEPSVFGRILALITVVGFGYGVRGRRIILWSAILIGIVVPGFFVA